VFALPTTAKLTPCSFPLHWLTNATEELMATTAATNATFLAGKHRALSPATATATVMTALNALRYLAKTVCFHFSGPHHYGWGLPGLYDESK
jgi:hypothetical protein